ncbi:MAG TPA: glycoside hydrolase family 9 protein [Candidatus Hydrogenedentes bacterium]|nr:glycoside hydrolase family 9 protein [Candidatus Hydrogenedentota bacterium]
MNLRRIAAVLFVCVASYGESEVARVYDTTWVVSPDASAWTYDAGLIDSARAYIVECRFSGKRPSGWLAATVLNSQGDVLREFRAEAPMPGANETRFFALQTSPVESAHTLRISGGSETDGTFSNLRVIPAAPRLIGNASFSLPIDSKNRIPYWNEESASILPTPRGGTVALDPGTGNKGPGCLTLTATEDWVAVGSLNYPIPNWTDRFHAEAWAKCATDAEAAIAVIWSDDSAGNVLRTDISARIQTPEWVRLTTATIAPPPDAKMVRIVLIARGTVQFDDAELVSDLPVTPSVRVVVNQAGYEASFPKHAIVMTNVLPAVDATNTFAVTAEPDARDHKGELYYAGRIVGQGGADWGWYFWRADFSDLKKLGTYRARAGIAGHEGVSHNFEIGVNQLFRTSAHLCVDFFFVQRCGGDVPGWHKPCHMDDARMPDGTHRDLTGGWHSAGDYNKLTWEYGDGGVTYALSLLAERDPAFNLRFNRDEAPYEDVVDEAIWGAQYLAKLQNEDGSFLKDIQQGPDRETWMRWSAPDTHTDNVRGTPDDPIVIGGAGNSPLAIGAWARLSRILSIRDKDNAFLDNAVKAWAHARAKGNTDPLLLVSTVDLFVVTKDESYRAFAQQCVESILAAAPAEGRLGGGYADSGDVPAAALAHFVNEMPNDPLKSRIKDRLKTHIESFVTEPQNAFGISRQKLDDDGHYFEPTSAYGHNFEYLCRAWSALKVYRAIDDRRALVYALDHLNFVLGANPYDLCMMEAVGTVNPPRYHHRYIKIPGRELGKVPGAIPNGFVRDMIGDDRPGFDLSLGGREYPSYRTSEPWLVHNVFYLLAIAELRELND